jgi:hypothetical protein
MPRSRSSSRFRSERMEYESDWQVVDTGDARRIVWFGKSGAAAVAAILNECSPHPKRLHRALLALQTTDGRAWTRFYKAWTGRRAYEKRLASSGRKRRVAVPQPSIPF